MDGLVDFVLLASVGAALTKITDLIRSTFDPDAKLKGSPVWIGVAMLLGTAFTVRTGMNALAGVDWAVQLTALEGQIATGLAVGGLASGNHELFDWLSGAAKRAHAVGGGVTGLEPTEEVDSPSAG